jgi:DNA-binding response OmpR family regulator
MNPRALKKIVIVEDNVALADIYKTRLDMLGYHCFAAYDGVQALAVIEKELPDLVLLDLMVPKIAGDQILERMRESDWGKNIKVMVISNLNESEAPAGLRNLGIEAYAVKANLQNDQIDQLVDAILKPANQVEDVILGQAPQPEVETLHTSGSIPQPPSINDPYSGTRFGGNNDQDKPPSENTENSH